MRQRTIKRTLRFGMPKKKILILLNKRPVMRQSVGSAVSGSRATSVTQQLITADFTVSRGPKVEGINASAALRGAGYSQVCVRRKHGCRERAASPVAHNDGSTTAQLYMGASALRGSLRTEELVRIHWWHWECEGSSPWQTKESEAGRCQWSLAGMPSASFLGGLTTRWNGRCETRSIWARGRAAEVSREMVRFLRRAHQGSARTPCGR